MMSRTGMTPLSSGEARLQICETVRHLETLRE